MNQLGLNGQAFELKTPVVMGILNATPDSFSDGGQFNQADAALKRIDEMIAQGAQMIDVGAESTRPGSEPVPDQEEMRRLEPILKAFPKQRCILSVDTNKIEVQKWALEKGAHIINDIYGGSEELFAAAQGHGAGLVLMHTSAAPSVMQQKTDYEDVVRDLYAYFKGKADALKKYNIPQVWFDPGIGFGKTLDQNLEIMRSLEAFKELGYPLLLGSSRKSWIEKLTGAPVQQRLGGSLASVVLGYQQGVDVFRVHDVHETVQALEVAEALSRP